MMTDKKTSSLEWRCIEYCFEPDDGDYLCTVQWDGLLQKWIVNGSRSLSFDSAAAAMHYCECEYKNSREQKPKPIKRDVLRFSVN